MRCPKCGTRLNSHTLHDVSVDECPSCHGVWLDAGELEALAALGERRLDRALAAFGVSTEVVTAGPGHRRT